MPTEAVADAPDGTKALAASSSTDDVDYADSSAARTSTDTTDDAVEPPAAKAPAAEKAAAVDGAKGDTRGQYAIYTYASPADGGMVTTNVSSADEMDDVYITAAPAAGYAVSEVVVTNSDGEEQRTFTQDDGTVLFWMPGSLARVYVTFTPTGASDPVVIDNEGWGTFRTRGGNVSIWVHEEGFEYLVVTE